MKKKKFDPQNLTGRKQAAKTTQMKHIIFHTKGRDDHQEPRKQSQMPWRIILSP